LEADLAPSLSSRERETLPGEAAAAASAAASAPAAAAAAAAAAVAAAVTSNGGGSRSRGGSVTLRSRSCSGAAWPGPEDVDENLPRITVEEAAAFMGSAVTSIGVVGAAGFGLRFASRSSWNSTATSAIVDIDRSLSSSLPPGTPTHGAAAAAGGSTRTHHAAGVGGTKGENGRGGGGGGGVMHPGVGVVAATATAAMS
ncbi:unnamed protein product, partial [Laminaria digitata]